MSHLLRPWVSLSVAALTATAVTFAPPAPEHAPPPLVQVTSQPVRLSAAVQPQVSAAALPDLLVDFVNDIVLPPSAGAAFPTPQFPPTVVGNSIGTAIENAYNAIEPWVQWGFEVAAYAVGWIPWVGWLAPQIMIFYNLGERIVRSITFNIADWIDHEVTFVQGLRNVIVDSINSFIYFINDELAFFLPPLPPIPPIGGSLSTADTNLVLATAGAEEPGTAVEAAGRNTGSVDEEPTVGDEKPAVPTRSATVSEPEITDVDESELVDESASTEEIGSAAEDEPATEAEQETAPEASDDLDTVEDLTEIADDTPDADDSKGVDPTSGAEADTTPDAGPDAQKPDTKKSDIDSETKAEKSDD